LTWISSYKFALNS